MVSIRYSKQELGCLMDSPSKSHMAKRKMTLMSKLDLGLNTLNISKKFLKLMRPDPSSLNMSDMRAQKGL